MASYKDASFVQKAKGFIAGLVKKRKQKQKEWNAGRGTKGHDYYGTGK